MQLRIISSTEPDTLSFYSIKQMLIEHSESETRSQEYSGGQNKNISAVLEFATWREEKHATDNVRCYEGCVQYGSVDPGELT